MKDPHGPGTLVLEGIKIAPTSQVDRDAATSEHLSTLTGIRQGVHVNASLALSV
jgi:hypothetical protein